MMTSLQNPYACNEKPPLRDAYGSSLSPTHTGVDRPDDPAQRRGRHPLCREAGGQVGFLRLRSGLSSDGRINVQKWRRPLNPAQSLRASRCAGSPRCRFSSTGARSRLDRPRAIRRGVGAHGVRPTAFCFHRRASASGQKTRSPRTQARVRPVARVIDLKHRRWPGTPRRPRRNRELAQGPVAPREALSPCAGAATAGRGSKHRVGAQVDDDAPTVSTRAVRPNRAESPAPSDGHRSRGPARLRPTDKPAKRLPRGESARTKSIGLAVRFSGVKTRHARVRLDVNGVITRSKTGHREGLKPGRPRMSAGFEAPGRTGNP